MGWKSAPRKGPVRAQRATERRNSDAAQLVAEAIRIHGHESLAAELSDGADRKVDKTQVSRWQAGKETMPLRALVPLLEDARSAPAALVAMTTRAAEHLEPNEAAELAEQLVAILAPRLELVPRQRMRRAEAEAAQRRVLARMEGVRQAVNLEAANAEGVSLEELERALASDE